MILNQDSHTTEVKLVSKYYVVEYENDVLMKCKEESSLNPTEDLVIKYAPAFHLFETQLLS